MKQTIIILTCQILAVLAVAQEPKDSVRQESFFTVIKKTEASGIVFKLDVLDTLQTRTDSIFKSWQFESGYRFESYGQDGRLIGEGFFHFHCPKLEMDCSMEFMDRILLKSNDWKDIHVCAFTDCSQSKDCDLMRLYRCNTNYRRDYLERWPGILLGSETGRTFTGKEIRRMPGR